MLRKNAARIQKQQAYSAEGQSSEKQSQFSQNAHISFLNCSTYFPSRAISLGMGIICGHFGKHIPQPVQRSARLNSGTERSYPTRYALRALSYSALRAPFGMVSSSTQLL
jgi:hypothetical protein